MADDPAAYLRETAALMREQVDHVDGGIGLNTGHDPTRWAFETGTPHDDGPYVVANLHDDSVGGAYLACGLLTDHTGRYIAAWDPPVALMVAEWLDHAADYVVPDPHSEEEPCPDCAHVVRALAVAKTYRRDA